MTRSTAHAGGNNRGRGARSPGEIPPRGWWDILRRTLDRFSADRTLMVAAGVTFYSLLALVPAMASFITLYGLLFDPQAVTRQIAVLTGVLPDGAIGIIRDQATRIASQSGGTLSVALIASFAVSLWSANAGVKAMMDALNVAYGEEEKRSFLALNGQSLIMTLGAIVLLIAILAGVAAAPGALDMLGFGATGRLVITWGRWIVMLAVVVFALAVLYRYGPSREKPQWRWITWGSATAAVGWLVFSLLFSWYVGNFADYNETYGSLGAIVGFMTWMWLSATIVLTGAELNAEIEHQTTRDSTTGEAEPRGCRGARMADTVGEARN